MSDWSNQLSDIRVLELGHVVSGPYATLMMADLGAEVLKVEHPKHGDHMRVAGDMARAIFATLNRDKQSLALDLKADDDRSAFFDLLGDVDVIVENFSPGTMDALGLGYDRLREANEQLIYVDIKGFGPDGPYRDRSATDPIIQAISGLMSVTGNSDRPPARAGTSVVDIATAQNAVVGTLVALRRRAETGRGTHVPVPMFRTGVALMGYWLAFQQMYDQAPQRSGASHPIYAPYNVYPTEDGYVFIGAASDEHWQTIRETMDLSLEYENREERLAARGSIDEAISEATCSWSKDSLVDTLLEEGVPAAPVNEVGDVIQDEHLTAVDAFVEIGTSERDSVSVPSTIPWSSVPPHSDDPPQLGADTERILQRYKVDTE